MSNTFRYVCLALGAVLIAVGWIGINSQRLRNDAIERVGGLVAAHLTAESACRDRSTEPRLSSLVRDPQAREMLSSLGVDPDRFGTGAAPARRVTAGQIIAAAVTCNYAAAIFCVMLGAGVCGFAVPSGPLQGRRLSPGVLLKRPHLIMFALAGIYFVSGAAVHLSNDASPGFLRSTAILLLCGLLTWAARRSRAIGLVGYGVGFVLTPLIGLNFVRLALKRPLGHSSFANEELLILLAAAASFLLFVGMWRAMPGGTDTRRFTLQVRRLAAGVGVAAVFAGICIFKTTMLPQQALAELHTPELSALLDDPEIQTALADPRVQTLLEDPQVREKLVDMGFSKKLVDLGRSKVAAVQGHEPPLPLAGPATTTATGTRLRPHVDATGTQATAPASETPGGETVDAVDTKEAVDPSDALMNLSHADIQRLLDAAGIKIDAGDPRVQEKIRQYRTRIDLDDPCIRQALAEIAAGPTGQANAEDTLGEVVQKAASTARSATGQAHRPSPPPEADTGLPRKVYGIPSSIQTKAANTRVNTRAEKQGPPHRRFTAPPPPPKRVMGLPEEPEGDQAAAGPLEGSARGQRATENGQPAHAARLADRQAGVDPAPGEPHDAEVSLPQEAQPMEEPADTSGAAEPVEPVGPDVPGPDVHAAAVHPPPDPPAVDDPAERFVRGYTHQAIRIGLLTMLTGAAVFFFAIFLRGGRREADGCAT